METSLSGKTATSKMAVIVKLSLPDNDHFNKCLRIDAVKRSAL